MNHHFPFSAVVGQEQAQLALLLAAVDPGIGGVLLRGDKGSAKSTLARGLARLLATDAPFVELPIGATEDRVLGSLDLQAVLAPAGGGSGAPAPGWFRPGLLAAAHRGVLYVDEVNLLPDHLVDTLLDVAASGVNRVERDGISHEHPARFVLLGSMNPEEGELRPQLLDRFGLSVEVRTPQDPALRAEAVRRRLAHDAGVAAGTGHSQPSGPGPDGPVGADGAGGDAAIGRRLAGTTPAALPTDVVAFAARLAVEVGAESLRADLVLCRAAAALAGWEGRDRATADDVARVAPMALAHRRRRRPFDPPSLPLEDLQDALDNARHDDTPPPSPHGAGMPPAEAAGPDGSGAADGPDGSGAADGPDGSGAADGPDDGGAAGWGGPDGPDGAATGVGGADPTGRWGALAGEALSRPPATVHPVTAYRRPAIPTADGSGRTVADRPLDPRRPGGLAVLPTVRAAILRQAGEDSGPGDGLRLRHDDLREPMRTRRQGRTVVLAVDASGSMGTRARIEAATGAVLGLLADAYLRRDQVALVAFRGGEATEALSPTQSVELARARLADLPTGGATPLAQGLRLALDVARRSAGKGWSPLLVLLSDGRATGEPGALDRAREAAGAVAASGLETLVLDAEDGPGGLGLAAELAGLMGAQHVRLAELTASGVETAIRSRALGA